MAAQDEKRESSIDFTGRAGRQVREALRDPDFRDADMDVIYETLKEKVQILSFGDHLKRYLYRKAGMSRDYLQIPPETYRTVLCNAFKENQTP